jgi:putative ABC transport system permease protein
MRRVIDLFSVAVGNLAEHALRSALTTLGMMFGVGAVIAMLSIGAGAERQALSLIERLGTQNVVIRARELKPDELAEVRKKSLGLSERDLTAIEEAIPGVRYAAPKLEVTPAKIVAAGAKTTGHVFGVGERQVEVAQLVVGEGRFFDAGEVRHHAQVCVIGAGVRRDLFGPEPALGKDVKLEDLWCQVIGVLAPDPAATGPVQGIALMSSDREIYLPVSTVLAKLDRDPQRAPLGEVVARLAPGASASEAGTEIAALLDRLHGGAKDVDIVVPEALLRESEHTQHLFDLVMGLIAGISLLVGGVGIMNIMLASVLEQTREIGVRRAVGARRRDVELQFLVTAFTLALLGGALGVAVGVGISHGVAVYAGWPTLVTLRSIALALGVSVGVGIVSGFYPARRAARLDPIQALAAA